MSGDLPSYVCCKITSDLYDSYDSDKCQVIFPHCGVCRSTATNALNITLIVKFVQLYCDREQCYFCRFLFWYPDAIQLGLNQ